MNCWKCGAILSDIGKFSFRAVCEKCDAALHWRKTQSSG